MTLKDNLLRIIYNFSDDECLLLDDDSIFSQIFAELLTQLNITFQKISPLDLESLLKRNQKIEKYLILPLLNFRIFNINYDRHLQKPLAMLPYWVHIRDDRNYSLAQELKKFFKDVLINPLENDDELLKVYLSDVAVTQWLTGLTPNERHNDFFERNLWRKYFPQISSDLYKTLPLFKSQSLEEYLSRLLSLTAEERIMHFPIHSLMTRMKLPPLPINQLEQEIYGFKD